MRATRECERCRTPLNNDAPDGFCPACMLEGALRLGGDLENERDEMESSLGLPRIGDYQLLEELARGGMGVVYRARQLSLGRTVAVKLILLGQFADESAVRRFKAEASAAGKLRHPNIVTIHEIGSQGGQHFFSMEYIDGESLADYIRKQVVTTGQAAEWVKIIAEAVQYAHGQGIVHRDLKPANILIDCFLAPHITDFGLARDLETDSELTLTGQVLGSPHYISPEQAAGKAAGIGSDIYSLGAILYHLLCGRPPFTADTITKTLQQVSTEEAISPRLLNPSVPRDLETICLKCLEKEPTGRYQSAGELADELRRFLAHEPIRARPIGGAAKAWRWARRKPVVAGLSGAFLLSVLLGFAGVTWQWQRAEQKAEESRRNLYAADMIRAQNAVQLGSIGLAQELLGKYMPRPGERDLRGWEWRFIVNQCKSDERFTLKGHQNHVFKLLCVSNAAVLVSAGALGELIVWDLKTRQPSKRIGHPRSGVTDLVITKDQTKLLVPDSGGQVIKYDLKTWQPEAVLTNLGRICALKLSPNERFLALYGPGGVQLWDFKEEKFLKTFPLSGLIPNQTCGLAFSPDSSLLAYSLADGRIGCWDLVNARHLNPLAGHQNYVHAIEFSPNGTTLISGSRDHTVREWDLLSGVEIRKLTNFTSFVLCATFDPSGRFLAAGGAGQQIHLFQAESWQEINTFRGHSDNVRSLVFTPDSKTLFSSGRDGTIKAWPVSKNTQPITHAFPPSVRSATLLENAKGLYLLYTNDTYAYWTAEPLREVFSHTLPMRGLQHSGLSPDGRLWLGETADLVALFEAESHRLIAKFPIHATASSKRSDLRRKRFAFSADGQTLALAGNDLTCRAWSILATNRNFQEPKQLGVFPLRTSPIWTIKLLLNGRILAIGYEPGLTELWNIQSGHKVATLGEDRDVWSVADITLSRDMTKAITASGSGKVRLWDVRSQRLIAALSGQLGSTYSVAFSPDETRIAACGGDGTVRIWDVQTGAEVAAIQLHNDVFHQLAFNRASETLFVLDNRKSGSPRFFMLRAPKTILSEKIF